MRDKSWNNVVTSRDVLTITKTEFDFEKIRGLLLNHVFCSVDTNGFTCETFAQWQYCTISALFDFFTHADTMLKVRRYLQGQITKIDAENKAKYPTPNDQNCFYLSTKSYIFAANRIYQFVKFCHENRDFFLFLRRERVLPSIARRISHSIRC